MGKPVGSAMTAEDMDFKVSKTGAKKHVKETKSLRSAEDYEIFGELLGRHWKFMLFTVSLLGNVLYFVKHFGVIK